ncbi:MAG: type II toxin-antitoxin system PemK/MazF family toxin [Aliarcobacter butzleri]|nr:type II toxin-antitoxin system PemK/MazF family toxin [Aliarcobacter butzleri]
MDDTKILALANTYYKNMENAFNHAINLSWKQGIEYFYLKENENRKLIEEICPEWLINSLETKNDNYKHIILNPIDKPSNSSIKWINLNRWSLVSIEFGTPKKGILNTDDIECVNCNSKYKHGVNHDNEFSYNHMGIVLSKNIANSTIVVAPLTETKPGDENNPSRIILKKDDYNFIYKNTTILIDNLITIEKKKRIIDIKLKWIPLPLRRKILKCMFVSFKLK